MLTLTLSITKTVNQSFLIIDTKDTVELVLMRN